MRMINRVLWLLVYPRLRHLLILSEKQFRRRVNEYVQYYNEDYPPQGIDQWTPAGTAR